MRTHMGKLPSYTREQVGQVALNSFTWGGFCLRGFGEPGLKLIAVQVVALVPLRD
jgi:hypothetical protein